MKKIVITFLFILSIPMVAGAHAVPLDSSPASSAVLIESPERVEIRFSERIDVEASRITVMGPSGTVVSDGRAETVGEDPYRIAVSARSDGEGAYMVAWSVVSSDDGHFTKGAFPYAVGEGVVIESSLSSNTEIVQIATLPEILGMTVELFGHGLLWALVALMALVIRPLFVEGRLLSLRPLVMSAYGYLATTGVILTISGAMWQILYKTKDLAALHGSTAFEALPQYLSTVAGEATLYRMGASIAFILGVLVFRKAIVSSNRFTWQEGVLVAILAVFAFFRAKVSHATANHFFPDFSVGVNFIHLIEKDIWAGLLAILVLALVVPRTRELFSAMIGRVFALLTLNLAAVALTGSYIVWLHLKDFENLLTTEWGGTFLKLLVVATLLVCFRAYHSAAHAYRPRVFTSWLPLTLAAELVLAIMVIYASSGVIITSPPPENLPTPTYFARSEGAQITLDRYPYQDGMMRVRVDHASGDAVPAATLRAGTDATIELELDEVYPDTYLFSDTLIASDSVHTLEIRVPQENAYDAVAVFDIPMGVFDTKRYTEGKRHFDIFSLFMVLVALVGFSVALLLYRLNQRTRGEDVRVAGRHIDVAVLAGLFFATFACTAFVSALQSSALLNPYKTQCERDGNMWHMMLPSKAGVPLTNTPREGCMWGMGAYQYMFPVRAEYEFYSSLPKLIATIDFSSPPIAGQNTTFTVSLRNPDGTPATLFVDMEKLVHVVIVSKDQTVFAHLHPDDERSLTDEELRTTTFNLSYVFPKSGEYLMSIDYANGITLESSQFPFVVKGDEAQNVQSNMHASPSRVGDFDVALKYSQPVAGEVSTLVYTISKNGAVAELEPYLSAAMHIAIVKNDFSTFAHVHGEVHPPGAELPPVIVKEGKIVHSMESMITPPKFTYPIDVHVLFPSAGLYTLWGQFQSEGVVYAVPFSVRVEE